MKIATPVCLDCLGTQEVRERVLSTRALYGMLDVLLSAIGVMIVLGMLWCFDWIKIQHLAGTFVICSLVCVVLVVRLVVHSQARQELFGLLAYRLPSSNTHVHQVTELVDAEWMFNYLRHSAIRALWVCVHLRHDDRVTQAPIYLLYVGAHRQKHYRPTGFVLFLEGGRPRRILRNEEAYAVDTFQEAFDLVTNHMCTDPGLLQLVGATPPFRLS
ncbi:hypothetical protein COV06_00685 [Candidatus Uhrbacteria bacterium CG10_big_fil_rev_8_21_14_0_10_50_16]|uniref:Uncharacterized protein n=1 Tax=Candidatus Uhrbacteria bacterium CG10_big_fil_rev_8_21_14_0_10_50_16 TaxID=1975039 RepID=A0A2H0RN20_9BACT|nr:MAG: hypothetical protein COV06_00685 [Candidatus Uhrbacteria bacterium CG10_big_fil_rev_8_21_14_0_10_50_16]